MLKRLLSIYRLIEMDTGQFLSQQWQPGLLSTIRVYIIMITENSWEETRCMRQWFVLQSTKWQETKKDTWTVWNQKQRSRTVLSFLRQNKYIIAVSSFDWHGPRDLKPEINAVLIMPTSYQHVLCHQSHLHPTTWKNIHLHHKIIVRLIFFISVFLNLTKYIQKLLMFITRNKYH